MLDGLAAIITFELNLIRTFWSVGNTSYPWLQGLTNIIVFSLLKCWKGNPSFSFHKKPATIKSGYSNSPLSLEWVYIWKMLEVYFKLSYGEAIKVVSEKLQYVFRQNRDQAQKLEDNMP